MYHKLLFILLLLTSHSLYANYTLKQSKRTKSKIDRMPKNIVKDMLSIPQNPAYYANQIKSVSWWNQRKQNKKFDTKYFKPWHISKMDIPKQDFGWEIRFVQRKPIYYVKGSEVSSRTYGKWIRNANYKAIDTKKYKAITVRRTNVKALPTKAAFYRDPKKTGEGFPFNYNQNSALHINIPLHISHFSKDKKWAFVRASYSFGWVKVADIAIVDRQFRKYFENDNYSMIIKDNLRLYNEENKEISFVKLGALFPKSKDKKHYLVAKRSPTGKAIIYKVNVQNPKLIAKKPLAFTPENVAKVANEFYGEPYGWGGSYQCRDCSATTRDFLGVFGIFLRRNSSKQALDGKKYNIKGLTKALKKRTIIKQAEPFRSLLHVPGHIVLYLGEYKGEPVVMHTYWGIRKKNFKKLITARTIITTTEPGKERSDIREKSKLINTLKTIVTF